MVRQMFADLFLARELAWRLFVRDFSAQYRQSLLGYVWVLLPPLVSTAIWVFLNNQGIMKLDSTSMPYPVYVFSGTLLWEAFVAALHAPLAQVVASTSLLSKINFPREALLLAGLGQVLFDTAVRLVLLAGVLACFQVAVPATIALAPLGVLAVIGLGFMLGVLLVPLGVLYQDVGRVVSAGVGLLFFLTPVVYSPPTTWPASLLTNANPISPLLTFTRDMLVTGDFAAAGPFALISGLTACGLIVGWILYRLAMPHLIARMSA
jgi:lipopolysaccharide transport system permease protein